MTTERVSLAALTGGSGFALRRPGRETWRTAGVTVVAVAVAVGLSVLLVAVSGGSPSSVIHALYTGSVASRSAWSQTLVNAAPLLLVALGACIGNRAGVFNIGQEGQLIVGAMVGCWVALHLAGPGWVVIVLALGAAALGGAVWAGASAVAYYKRGTNVVVSTLLMTFVGLQLVNFSLNKQWLLQQKRTHEGTLTAQSDMLPPYLQLPNWGQAGGLTVGAGFILAVVATAVLGLLINRSRWGFRLRMLGLNPIAARHAGIRAPRLGGSALALSGAFAGLAGGVILMGTVYRLQPALANNFGWDGLLVALVARSKPLLALPVAVLFGALRAGASFLAATGVPNYLVDIVQALLVLAFVVPPVLSAVLAQRSRDRQASLPRPTPAPAKEAVTA